MEKKMRKDLEKYIASMSKQVDAMTKAVEEAQKLATEGALTQEQVDNICAYATAVRSNYERVLYVRHLLMLPPKFIQKIRAKKLAKEQQKFVEAHSDRESVEKENEASIEAVKEITDGRVCE